MAWRVDGGVSAFAEKTLRVSCSDRGAGWDDLIEGLKMEGQRSWEEMS